MKQALLINETFAIDEQYADGWISWMNKFYLPKLKTVDSISHVIFSKVNMDAIEGAHSYALQFVIANNIELEKYTTELKVSLLSELNHSFANKYASFVTELNIITHYT